MKERQGKRKNISIKLGDMKMKDKLTKEEIDFIKKRIKNGKLDLKGWIEICDKIYANYPVFQKELLTLTLVRYPVKR